MKYYVGITDGAWFQFLRQRQPDEVNFWRPSAKTAFRAIDYGAPFLFKLHRPKDYIVGGGFFTGYSRIPLSMAWQAFGEKNGAPDYKTLRERITTYRSKHGFTTIDPEIGCIVLSNPFFFHESDWISPPEDWGYGIMQGKTYDSTLEPGLSLWRKVSTLLIGNRAITQQSQAQKHRTFYSGPILGKKYLQTARLGQGAFRIMTLENFHHTCCITGETTVPVLEAAHIQPVSQDGEHSLKNGLLLRADLHILYDKGLVGVDPEYQIRISSEIARQYLNGRIYYSHNGAPLRSLPKDPELRPSPSLLEWHMNNIFVA